MRIKQSTVELITKPLARAVLGGQQVEAGFGLPDDQHLERPLDLNELLIEHASATFFVRVRGDSMENAGIYSNDILIVDRALTAADTKIVVARLDGELTVKRLRMRGSRVTLISENPLYKPISVAPEQDFEVWGVVTYVIHRV